MPIASPIGYLDVVNATLRASQVEAVSRLSVANTATTQSFSVGERFHVNKDSVDPVSITGNVVASGVKIGNLSISPTFDFASVSNVGNVTANVIQFANATTGFVTTANVEIGGNITLTANAQVKVGSNVLAEYTGPHGREPKEVPLKKFPEIVFDASKVDGNDTTNTYVQAGYVASASTQDSTGFAYLAFDGIAYGSRGYHGTGVYSSGVYQGSAKLTGPGPIEYDGEWIKLELPHKIKVTGVSFAPRTYFPDRIPHKGYILGSNTGSDGSWELVHSFDNVTTTEGVTKRINFTGTGEYYKHIAMVAEETNPTAGTRLNFSELEYYGYEEPAPPGDLSLDTTIKSTFNSVRSNNYVMYFDGEGFDPNDTNSNNLVTGSSVSVVHHNATYDSTGKYWTLDGSTESNVTTGSLGFEGDVPHTVSMWVNASNVEDKQLFTIGSGYDKSFLKVDDTQIAANTWHNVTYAYQGEGGSKVTYVDGRKVVDDRVEDTFGEYPPFAMDDYTTGGYKVTASTEFDITNYNSWKAFNKNWHNNGNTNGSAAWLSDNSTWYGGADGLYNRSPPANLGTGALDGEWLKIEMPHRIKLDYIRIYPRYLHDNKAPRDFIVYGSNDNVNWTAVLTETGAFITSSDWESGHAFAADVHDTCYKYFGLVTRKLRANTTFVNIAELKLYGHKEGDLTRFPEPTRVLKYPHIAMTGQVGSTSGCDDLNHAQRGYIVTASGMFTGNPSNPFQPWRAFNNEYGSSLDGAGWVSIGLTNLYGGGTDNTYGTVRSANLGSDSGGTATPENGEWLKIELPHKIVLSHIQMVGNSADTTDHPKSFKLYGSTNGTTWVEVLSVSNTGILDTSAGTTFTPGSTPDAYNYFGLVVTATQSRHAYVTVIELKLYGTQEDTGTPAIVGGPFAGKVANFRVYDKYLGDERIQEIYDAQKDAFGHKKSSMTFYKGRIGVGTTEPEGALTVIDEPHALEKFPLRNTGNDNEAYMDGQGWFTISGTERGEGTTYADGRDVFGDNAALLYAPRGTRFSGDGEPGAFIKIKSPYAVSLKKADLTSFEDIDVLGGDIEPSWLSAGDEMGRSSTISHDGTRVAVCAPKYASKGRVAVYDYLNDVGARNPNYWTQVGNLIDYPGSGTPNWFGRAISLSGDGKYIAIGIHLEDFNGGTQNGTIRVYYLSGSTWTLVPDAGSLTINNVFYGQNGGRLAGNGVKLSYDGKTLAGGEYYYEGPGGVTHAGRVRAWEYSDATGSWTQKGFDLIGESGGDHFGHSIDMSEDGNHLIIGTESDPGSATNNYAKIYKWNTSTSAWELKGAKIVYPGGLTDDDGFSHEVKISNDGTVIAISAYVADIEDGARADGEGLVYTYHYDSTASPQWVLDDIIKNPNPGGASDYFGHALALSGDGKRLAISASNWDNGGDQGRVYVYNRDGSTWTGPRAATYFSGGGTDHYLGYGGPDQGLEMSRDGTTLIAGELGENSNTGRARVFAMGTGNFKGIWGSNDDKNWTRIVSTPTREESTSNVAGIAFGVNNKIELKNIDNPNYYTYHAIVYDNYIRPNDAQLYGIRKKEVSTLHDGQMSLTKNLTVPRIGAPIGTDHTPRRDRLVVEYNTSTNPEFYNKNELIRDTSGKEKHGYRYGASYSIRRKRLEFSGDLYIKGDLGLTGNYAHTVSLWFRCTNDGHLFWTGINGTEGERMNIFFSEDGGLPTSSTTRPQIHYTFKGHTHYAGVVHDRLTHLVCTYDGSDSTGRAIYINGNRVGTDTITDGSGDSATALNIVDSTFYINRSNYTGGTLEGSVSNFKFYDCALDAEEVRTLYRMGWDDSGHHVTNFEKTRVGIGLADGTAPYGALDVRGTFHLSNGYGQSYPFYDEGEFVPYLDAVNVPTYTLQYGRYTKIGNVVFVHIRIDYSGLNTSDGSGVHIGDMPFHSDETDTNCAMVSFHGDYHTMFSPSIGAGSRIDGGLLIIGHATDGNYVNYNECIASGSVNMVAQYFIP
jgi:hypothetical protein